MAILCGAKTRSGEPCKRAPTKGKARCKLHGGTSTGPDDQTGNANASTHGIYARYLGPEDAAAYAGVENGSVEHELKLARVRLMRALRAEQIAADRPELLELVENEGGGLTIAKESRKSVVKDYQAIIDKALARIESLERTRKILDAGDGDNGEIAGFETVPYES